MQSGNVHLKLYGLSLQVGRPRPNFGALCWPEGNFAWDENTGLALCSKDAKNPAEGRKSFPSGASAYSYFVSSLTALAFCQQ